MSIPKMPMGGPFNGHGVNFGSNVQLHFHGPDSTTLTGGYFKDLSTNSPASPRYLNGYECAMADYHAQALGLKKF